MKYYFFRDTDNESNLLDGKTYHAAGYVEKLYCELDKSNRSGKDLAVSFFEPFEGSIISAWRALSEVELFEVSELEYKQLIKSYSKNSIIQLEIASKLAEVKSIIFEHINKGIASYRGLLGNGEIATLNMKEIIIAEKLISEGITVKLISEGKTVKEIVSLFHQGKLK